MASRAPSAKHAAWAALLVVAAGTRPAGAAETKAQRDLRFELVFDRRLESYREVRVTRGGRLEQRLPLAALAPYGGGFRVRLADFDGDGQPDLVVSPTRGAKRFESTWLVFRFDRRTRRFRERPEQYALRDRSPVGSPAPGLRIEALISGGSEDSAPVPDSRSFPIVILRGEEIAYVVPNGRYFTLLDRDDPLASVDVDFDGHPDLAVDAGGNGNQWLLFWRFDPTWGKTGRFVFSRELSALPNPRFDPRRKEIRSWENQGAAGAVNRAALHRFFDGKLELLWDAQQDDARGDPPALPPGRGPVFEWRIRRRFDGRMKEVCRAYVDIWQKKPKVLKVVAGSPRECRR